MGRQHSFIYPKKDKCLQGLCNTPDFRAGVGAHVMRLIVGKDAEFYQQLTELPF